MKDDPGFIYYIKKRTTSAESPGRAMRNVKQLYRWMATVQLALEEMGYHEVIDYVEYLDAQAYKYNTVNQKIKDIEKWMDYRLINPNPCKLWYRKRRPRKTRDDLLSEIEMNEMYLNYPQVNWKDRRDKVILGLMIYQGMLGSDVMRLAAEQVNIEAGYIMIKTNGYWQTRVLMIAAQQKALLTTYKAQRSLNDPLFIETRATDKKSWICSIQARIRKRCAAFKSSKQLRASRITAWLAQHDLRQVQYMAGHKHILSTELYLSGRYEDLQKQLDELHPLK